jgi:hypothetical protein
MVEHLKPFKPQRAKESWLSCQLSLRPPKRSLLSLTAAASYLLQQQRAALATAMGDFSGVPVRDA